MSTTTSGEEPPSKGTRRRDAEVNSIPQLSSLGLKPLKEALEGMLESGQHADVIFIVGGGHGGQGDGDGGIGRREIPAHKCILSARSEVFGAMLEERWNGATKSGENSNVVRIEIDSSVNPKAFEQIIKFIYNDDVASCLRGLEFEELFEFRSFAEMYGINQLKDAASYKIAHDLVKDYRKCFLTLEQEIVDQDLRAVAFSVLKWNLAKALVADDLPSRWTEQIWENVLKDKSLTLDEVLLFKGLWRWKEQDRSSRKEAFQKLLRLIRFAIMSSSDLLTVVRPKHAISSDELLNILHYQIVKTTPALRLFQIGFSTEKRGKKVKWVTSFDELKQTLDEISVAEDEDEAVEVFLLPGNYSGVVDVNKDFVKLTGFGPYTILQGQESGIKISSNQTTLSNLTLQGTMTILHVTGNCNLVKNIVGTINNPMFALVVKGASNVFENFSFLFVETSAVQLEDYELDCEAKRKEFTAFCQEQGIEWNVFLNATTHLHFVWSDGPRNKFANFQYIHLKNRNMGIAFEYQTRFTVTKNDNVIQKVNFGEMSAIYDGSSLSNQPSSCRPPSFARLSAASTGLRVSDCSFDEINVYSPSGQHHFKRVVVAKRIVVKGSDHKFEDCRYGQMIDLGKNTVTSDCVTVPEWLATEDGNKTI